VTASPSENPARTDELSERWLTVDGLAELLDVSRDFVYAHARELGGRKLGTSRKAPWRFRLEDVLAATSCQAVRLSVEDGRAAAAVVEPYPRKHRPADRTSSGTNVPLLPIRGARGS
jgi:hypothetical protein